MFAGFTLQIQDLAVKLCTFKDLVEVVSMEDFLVVISRFENACSNNR